MASNHESIRAKKPKEEELIQEFSLGQDKAERDVYTSLTWKSQTFARRLPFEEFS